MRSARVISALLWLHGGTSVTAVFLPLSPSLPGDGKSLASRQVKGDNCTDRSLALKTLRVFGGLFSTGDRTGSESSSIVFRLGNPLTGANERCAAEGPQVTYDPDHWYNCDHLADPTAPRSSFRYGSEENELEVQGTWICSDKDPLKPLSLDAFASGSIPWVCANSTDAAGRYERVCVQEKDVEVAVEMSSRSATDG